MQPLNFVQNLLNQNQISDNLSLVLRPGQIISGKVMKLFPNGIAEVLVGSNKVIAQLEAPLSVNERHWFQVQSGEGKVHLRVLEANGGNGTDATSESVLKELALPNSKVNTTLLQFFQNKHLPITKETVHIAAQWLKGKILSDGLKVLDAVLSKQLPFTKNVFNSLYAIQEDEPISSLLDKLQALLKNGELSDASRRLISIMEQLRFPDSKPSASMLQTSEDPNTQFIKDEVKTAIKTIGFSYENETVKLIKDNEPLNVNKMEALKPILLRLLSEEAAAPIHDAAEKLLNKITGYQVLSQEAGPIQQLIFQIPLTFWDKRTDLTMQWSGRKNENGQIDPNFCRILFYLNLDHLKETIVDLHVQNRVISISVVNHHDDLKTLAQQYIPILKERLEEIKYHLSTIHFEKPIDKKETHIEKKKALSSLKLPNHYIGVDFRI
ncbi:hypothetical protein RRV45_09280 [Bacillus sp. DTU_2020_1000418_1_SI_GHA_SEK_038]|uniref:hypothetical protein n=1 Tax=Bacillus sp. DTU_2020_1000418_1_SI_GHA_SEK_038 TaxID=3077585 RepID=UPI0028E95D6D|nr:hypothetical protein [Bacillus sp. DTU_2020_1000418_1_SI_GHA_SEK_038]WNS77157.1 hypothetical protein RRV45_09280 [Bacillus sp. DTU_2020_1000418_1_SI_GHA_SEK_038]